MAKKKNRDLITFVKITKATQKNPLTSKRKTQKAKRLKRVENDSKRPKMTPFSGKKSNRIQQKWN